MRVKYRQVSFDFGIIEGLYNGDGLSRPTIAHQVKP